MRTFGHCGPLFWKFRDAKSLQADEDYPAAKSGDTDAAIRLVQRMIDPDLLERCQQEFGTRVRYVAVHAEELSGRNRIPSVLAEYLSAATGADADLSIIQANRAYHTGAGAMERLLARAEFSGNVIDGARYVLVDDVTTMGSTLADLAHHIRSHGGQVAGSVLLSNAMRNDMMALDRKTSEKLEVRYGNEIRELFDIEPAALTGSEAGYLIGFRTADELRNRAAKARQERSSRLLSKGVSQDSAVTRSTHNLPPSDPRPGTVRDGDFSVERSAPMKIDEHSILLRKSDGMEHHERFATCLNRLVDHLKKGGMREGDAVTLSGFTGMAHLDAAREGSARDPDTIGASVAAFYQKAGIAVPGSADGDDLAGNPAQGRVNPIHDAVQFFQQELLDHDVDLRRVADYVFGPSSGASATSVDPGSSMSGGMTMRYPDGPENDVFEGEIMEGDEEKDADLDAEFEVWNSPGRVHPELSDQMVTLLRTMAIGIRMTQSAQGSNGNGGGLVDGMLKPFRLHVAHNRARHLEQAVDGLREFDRLVNKGPAKGESFAEHEAALKKAAGDFLKHAGKGMSHPGLATALKNGVDPKVALKLQDGFDAWKNMNGGLLEKMKLDKLAANIGQVFSKVFSKIAGAGNAPA